MRTIILREIAARAALIVPSFPFARVDADRTARPRTEIAARHVAGDCILPGVHALAYTYRPAES